MLTRLLVATVVLACACAAAPPKWNQLDGYTFEQYVRDFKKSHVVGTSTFEMRKEIFNAKLASIRKFNSEPHTYKKGVNRMTDWTEEELRRLNGRLPVTSDGASTPLTTFKAADNVNAPPSLDYRLAYPPILTAVKDQGMCGSCWAHAATETIESHWALATGNLFVLSQQQITSCTPNPNQCGGTGGCFGATAELAWDYVVAANGITQEWMYSYSSYFGDSGVCTLNSNQSLVAQLQGYVSVTRNSDADVQAALVAHGPLAISVDASMWFEYESGVYTGCNYTANISMDHAVQLVGYGHDDSLNLDYWLVRNSWSAGWGEAGYIRLLRTTECGWNVDWNTNGGGCPNTDNNTVWACGECGILYDVVYPIPQV